jgi:hypothetical protein
MFCVYYYPIKYYQNNSKHIKYIKISLNCQSKSACGIDHWQLMAIGSFHDLSWEKGELSREHSPDFETW